MPAYSCATVFFGKLTAGRSHHRFVDDRWCRNYDGLPRFAQAPRVSGSVPG